jgi:imidazolonepropionase-like amidohydrolase
VSAHVTDSRFLETAVNCGVDDAAHATWDRAADAVFQRMIARGIIMVPTLTVFDAYGSLAGAAENVRRFATLGGTVALGNDYTAIPQNHFDHFELGMPLHEIECMTRAGMSPMQIIVAATRNAAQACGLSDELGTLATGKTADILVVKGNPLDRLDALADVRLVVHRGVIIRRE